MNAKTDRSTTCLTNEQFANYLHERLPEEIENQLRTHIGQCSHCQDRLEASAATAEMWHEVSELPGDAGFPAAESDAAEDHAETKALLWSAIKDKLAASEDPRFSGRIGPYDVCAILGAGSTGIVLKAFESRLNRYVAIKVLAPTLAAQGAARKRFEREGRAIAAVSHEHVVPILAVDEFAGIPYLVMQYVPGVSLLQRIETSGSLDTCEVARIGFQVASGLAAAHRQGIIHRDVKPANVILEDTVERAMVTDFGIARVVDDGTMTRSGVISGTPQYMSPEQARGEVVDPRSDLFSLGGLMYAACAARAPFRAETVFGIIHRVCETEPRPIRDINPDIAPWLVQFIEKLMCKRPEGRFQSAPEVATLLEAELAHLQNPTSYAQPTRDWLQTSSGYPRETQSTVQSEPQSARQSTSTFPKDRRSTRNRLLIALAACAAAALALPSLDRRFELGILTPPEIGRPSLTTNSRPGNDTGDDQVPTSKA
ncbi:MAG: serine/threonine-protein kinase, partial [Planctomycetota bacterium]